jgi:hypothetical protein
MTPDTAQPTATLCRWRQAFQALYADCFGPRPRAEVTAAWERFCERELPRILQPLARCQVAGPGASPLDTAATR